MLLRIWIFQNFYKKMVGLISLKCKEEYIPFIYPTNRALQDDAKGVQGMSEDILSDS